VCTARGGAFGGAAAASRKLAAVPGGRDFRRRIVNNTGTATDMFMRATSGTNAGNFEVYYISNNAVTSAAALGHVGLEWQVAGLGDFSGNPGESDMLMRATTGPNAGLSHPLIFWNKRIRWVGFLYEKNQA
jgi:hypothetical protein